MLDAQTHFVPKTAFERENYLLSCTDAAQLDGLVARASSASSAAERLLEL